MKTPPRYRHGSAPRSAVLLLNLGTPAAPTAAALRRYLGEFLSDRRVVELPAVLWQPLLRGVILPLRAPKSAAKYASIWRADGSPLASGTRRLAVALEQELTRRGHAVLVRDAMRYGTPATADVLDALQREGVTRLLALPLYPQYCAATTASSLDAVMQWFAGARRQPELRTLRSWADDAGYIEALASKVRALWQADGEPEQLVISFHGMPARTLELGDPYFCECQLTARRLAEALQLPAERWRATFQSRFGRQAWLQPYTAPTLQELARGGCRRVDVICPGFAVDCLETLEEIGVEARELFLAAGGERFRYIECLNDDAGWVPRLADLAERHMQGWPQVASPSAALDASRARALAAGAAD